MIQKPAKQQKLKSISNAYKRTALIVGFLFSMTTYSNTPDKNLLLTLSVRQSLRC